MFAPILAAVLGFTHPVPTAPLVLGPEVDPQTPVLLAFSFELTHPAEMAALRQAQLDPQSPSYRHWLTPAEFGQQFGQPQALYARAQAWLRAAGFEVTPFDNNAFIEATGTAAQVKALLGVTLSSVQGAARSVHVPNQKPDLPAWLRSQILHVGGLDTQVRAHHRLYDSYGDLSLGPQDIRTEYDVTPMLKMGFYGQQQQLVVLGTALPPGSDVQAADVNYFYQNVSNASATFVEHQMNNPNDDFDTDVQGALGEEELDVEMQSIGSPGAATITLDEAPASLLFTVGPEDIVNNYPKATAVSTSFGTCESEELEGDPSEASSMETAIIQGTMEGQTWSAAAGDDGADDCQTGGAGPISVDFPGVLPEIVSMGGIQIDPVVFNRDHGLSPTYKNDGGSEGHQTEEVWNDYALAQADAGAGFASDDASGGGLSAFYVAPSYQIPLGFTARSVPDISLIAGLPYTIMIEPAGDFTPVEGTSIASPLSAGFFALIASWQGSRLGDPHSVLYQMGSAWYDGGFGGAPFNAPGLGPVFNDVTIGNNSINGLTGFAAHVGYDSASGWGTMDVYQLAQVWPAPTPQQLDAGWGTNDGGVAGTGQGSEYSQCTFSGCTTDCTTLTDGPSTCTVAQCDPKLADAGDGSGKQCPSDNACFTSGPYAGDGDGGACAPGCFENSDCSAGACNGCYNTCEAAGTAGAQIGSPCTQDSDCGPGGNCLTSSQGVYFDGGYCTADCNPFSNICAQLCGSNGSCQPFGENFYTCLEVCTTNADCNPGYVCQPQTNYCGDAGGVFFNPAGGGPCPSVCEPSCEIVDAGDIFGPDAGAIVYNTCLNPWAACDTANGNCVIVPGGGCVQEPCGSTGSTGTVGTIGTTGGVSATATASTGTATGTSGTSTTSGSPATASSSTTASSTSGSPATASASTATSGTSGSTVTASASTGATGATGKTTSGTNASTSSSTGAGTSGHSATASSSATGTTTSTAVAAAATGASAGAVGGSTGGGSTGAGGSGGGCNTAGGAGAPDLLLAAFGLAALARRRRR